MDLKQRMKKYNSSPSYIQDLYGDPELGNEMYRLFQSASLDEKLYDKYANVIGDTILGFEKITDLKSQLQQRLSISEHVATKISTKLVDYISPILEKERETTSEAKYAETTTLQTAFTTPTPEPEQVAATVQNQEPAAVTASQNENHQAQKVQPETAREAAEPEEESVVQPLRTMEADMDRIHGYGAYRKMFPGEGEASEEGEGVVHAASQDEVLKKE